MTVLQISRLMTSTMALSIIFRDMTALLPFLPRQIPISLQTMSQLTEIISYTAMSERNSNLRNSPKKTENIFFSKKTKTMNTIFQRRKIKLPLSKRHYPRYSTMHSRLILKVRRHLPSLTAVILKMTVSFL